MRYIYCYTNKINGHQYVGQTSNIKRRKNEHRSNSFNKLSEEYNLLFHKKLREYGEDNFAFTLLDSGEWDIEETNQKEIFWIEKLGTYCGDNNGGYNLTRGGQNKEHSRIYSKETIFEIKQKIKDGINYRDLNKEYGISISYLSELNNGNLYYDENEIYPLHKYCQSENELNYIIYLLEETDIEMTLISKIVNKSYSTIKKINSGALYYQNNIDYPLRKINSSKSKGQQVQKFLLEGKSDNEIIQLTGVSRQTISRINKGQTHYDNNLSYPLR